METGGTEFTPNFTVQPAGTTTWADPGQAGVALDPGLPVQVDEWREGWAHIVCSNGWTAWVDGRDLVPIPAREPEPEPEPEVDPLYQELSDALTRYRELANQAADGRLTPDQFRRQAFGIGHIVKDDVAWMLDITNKRWVRYDGISVTIVESNAGA